MPKPRLRSVDIRQGTCGARRGCKSCVRRVSARGAPPSVKRLRSHDRGCYRRRTSRRGETEGEQHGAPSAARAI